MSKRLSAIVFAAVVGLSGAALAALPPFDELDTDKDGLLSRTEAAKAQDLDFATADTNKDGMLDRSEYESAAG